MMKCPMTKEVRMTNPTIRAPSFSRIWVIRHSRRSRGPHPTSPHLTIPSHPPLSKHLVELAFSTRRAAEKLDAAIVPVLPGQFVAACRSGTVDQAAPANGSSLPRLGVELPAELVGALAALALSLGEEPEQCDSVNATVSPGGAVGRELPRLDPLQDRVRRHRAELGYLAGREVAGWLGGGQWGGETLGTDGLMGFIGSGAHYAWIGLECQQRRLDTKAGL